MRKTIQFQSEDEKDSILAENKDLYLIEVMYITEGNFLVFSDTLPESDIVYKDVSQVEFENIKQRQEATDAAVLQLMMEGMK